MVQILDAGAGHAWRSVVGKLTGKVVGKATGKAGATRLGNGNQRG